MICHKCHREMKSEKFDPYHYEESGLDTVYLQGVIVFKCERGHKLIHIPHIEMLHDAIAYDLLKKPPLFTAREFRFLRKCIGLTMQELASELGISRNTIHRYENKGEITRPSDHLLRMLVAKKKEASCQRQMYLEIAVRELFEKMTKKNAKSAKITIDVEKLSQHPSQASRKTEPQYAGG